MSKPRMVYFERDDVLHLAISDEPEQGSVELSPDITVELNAKGGTDWRRDTERKYFYPGFNPGISTGKSAAVCRDGTCLIADPSARGLW